ncbi:MAG: TetR/AcrR family transcriptional regulator [Hyphomonas sp.]|nr:TetR/AcrR family transcriptional regulator [Hyphomonas sp.]
MFTTTESHSRDRILETALELFCRNGFAGTSIRQIAAKVGLSPSSLYNHFDGKDAILEALIERFNPAHSADRLSLPAYEALNRDPNAFCRKYAGDWLNQWCDPNEQKFMELLNSEPQRLSEHRAKFSETLFEREIKEVAYFFWGFARAGLMNAPDPVECARLFMGGLTFVRSQYLLWPPKPAHKETVARALDRVVSNFLHLTAPAR